MNTRWCKSKEKTLTLRNVIEQLQIFPITVKNPRGVLANVMDYNIDVSVVNKIKINLRSG